MPLYGRVHVMHPAMSSANASQLHGSRRLGSVYYSAFLCLRLRILSPTPTRTRSPPQCSRASSVVCSSRRPPPLPQRSGKNGLVPDADERAY